MDLNRLSNAASFKFRPSIFFCFYFDLDNSITSAIITHKGNFDLKKILRFELLCGKISHLLISKILIPTHRSVTYKLWKNNPTKTSTQRTDLLVFELLEIDHAKDYHLFLFWIWSRPFLPQVKVVLWREICQFKDNLADLGPKDQISYNQGQIGRINQSEYDWKFGITNMIHKSRGYWIQPIYLTGICL